MKSVKPSSTDAVSLVQEAGREETIDLFNAVLSDEYLLHTKTRDYNWTISDPQMADLHDILYAQYKEIDQILDDVAERARVLGGRSLGALKEFLGQARLKTSGWPQPEVRQMVSTLLSDHETVLRLLKEEQARYSRSGDAETNEFLLDLIHRHEKMAWTLRAFLEFRAGQA